ncbi:MAG: alpha/beta fold hydrolase [Desulfobacteraceae bacterium]
MALTDPFRPSLLLKGAFLQTLLASSRLRTYGKNEMQAAAKQEVLRCNNSVRLQGAVSTPVNSRSKAMVILLHGWEGSMNSTYVLRTGKYLFNRGYTIYRINLRDHGQSHHLNEGLFFATLLDEVFEAVSLAVTRVPDQPVFLVGFSLGGNFALRIARQIGRTPIGRLHHIVAISPVLDPSKATDCIDGNPFLQYYFLRKWLHSLKKKQSLFAPKYDFTSVLNIGNVRKITEILIPQYTDFKNADEYFKGYSFTRSDLREVPIPTTIITAKDDPVIPVSDFYGLQTNSRTRLVIHPHGGHNGFIESMLLSCWYERKLCELFDQLAA